MRFCYPHGDGVFQQNNCTSHKSQLAIGWLDEQSSGFSVVNWPPKSPHLNPIEHLSDVLEQGVKGHTAPTNRTELWTALANICNMRAVNDRSRNFEPQSSDEASIFHASGRTLSNDKINVLRSPYFAGLQWHGARTHDTSVTSPCDHDLLATMATLKSTTS
ncbi:transposable element Tcb2 transposase [Trichonephila clavipes]|nr:transposable element Tcb2 transposase [Trichonephila clavipes]